MLSAKRILPRLSLRNQQGRGYVLEFGEVSEQMDIVGVCVLSGLREGNSSWWLTRNARGVLISISLPTSQLGLS